MRSGAHSRPHGGIGRLGGQTKAAAVAGARGVHPRARDQVRVGYPRPPSPQPQPEQHLGVENEAPPQHGEAPARVHAESQPIWRQQRSEGDSERVAGQFCCQRYFSECCEAWTHVSTRISTFFLLHFANRLQWGKIQVINL